MNVKSEGGKADCDLKTCFEMVREVHTVIFLLKENDRLKERLYEVTRLVNAVNRRTGGRPGPQRRARRARRATRAAVAAGSHTSWG